MARPPASDGRLGLLATVAVCAGVYRLCPRDGLPWRAALAGAAPAAIALQLVPTLGALDLQVVAGRTPVQVFLVLAGVLIVCNLVALSLLGGAVVAACSGRSRRVARRVVAGPRASRWIPRPTAVGSAAAMTAIERQRRRASA